MEQERIRRKLPPFQFKQSEKVERLCQIAKSYRKNHVFRSEVLTGYQKPNGHFKLTDSVRQVENKKCNVSLILNAALVNRKRIIKKRINQ